jgi:hypothetical protein
MAEISAICVYIDTSHHDILRHVGRSSLDLRSHAAFIHYLQAATAASTMSFLASLGYSPVPATVHSELQMTIKLII